jgi:DNA modification methylase
MIKILHGDCIESLKSLEDQSVNTCITSPPYYGLRDYGTADWIKGNIDCDHTYHVASAYNKNFNERWGNPSGNRKQESERHNVEYKKECKKCGAQRKDKQLGMEDTIEEFTENLVTVFKEVKRVLRDDGTVWLNLGDSYSKKQQLIGAPWRVALALQDDGWYLRQDIIWNKPNAMPESIKNRCTKAHEYIFLLSKNKKYYYDNEAIKEDCVGKDERKWADTYDIQGDTNAGIKRTKRYSKDNDFKRNRRSVWTVTTKPFKGAHFATFPKDLIEPCVLAGCPEKMCCDCGEPYQRQMKKTGEFQRRWSKTIATAEGSPHEGQSSMQNIYEDLGLQKQCDCETNETKGGIVLDPFGGSGTTGIVAANNNRNAILLELNAEYIELAKARIEKEIGMFVELKVEMKDD